MNSILPPQRISWRPDAEGLRGVAVLSVLIFHAVPSWLPGGFVGVDVFFVLSGFLIGHLIISDLATDRFSYATFYARRARRLFPSLIIVLVATLSAAPFMIGGEDYEALGQQAAASAMFAANFLAWAQSGYFDGEAAYKPLIHLWSLGTEEQFYALFPVALVYLWRHSFANVGRILSWAASLSFACCVVVTLWDGNAAFYLPFTRFWEFLVGARLAWKEHEKAKGGVLNPEVTSSIGALLLFGAFILVPEGPAFPGWQAAIPVTGVLLLLAAGQGTWINRVVLSAGFLRWMGQVSYAAYLWHWPILVFARYYTGDRLTPVLAVSLTVVSVLLAWISTRFVEHPFRSGMWSLEWGTARILWLCIATVGACAVPATNFIDARNPPQLAMLDHYPSPDYDVWREGKNCYVNLNKHVPFGKECLGGIPDRRPLAVLWGDSHAAHLWPGLEKSASAYGWRLAQLTVSQCPPLIREAAPLIPPSGVKNMKCQAMREHALETIRSLKPETVILASRWSFYEQNVLLEAIAPTVQMLKGFGVHRVVIIGPVPRWVPTLQSALANDMRRQRLLEPPLFTTTGLQEDVFTMNQDLRTSTVVAGADFVSTLSVLCETEKRCKAWVDENQKTTLMTYDGTHLTPQGSEWLAGRISAQIFK